ncbi:hypothetical protein ACIA5C_02930 [Actinoplanes sp. NPDC051343]|uniref:hypothetical protein n=1 Tax=Actinoplanes sp. NPDC051343 TaxID=3363906 RepID=UPI00378DF0E4
MIGATGGVGVTVLPLLVRAGARVVATATDTDRQLIADLGAEPIAYGDYPDGVDTVFNLVPPSDRRISGRGGDTFEDDHRKHPVGVLLVG